jgi:hypothetical protein
MGGWQKVLIGVMASLVIIAGGVVLWRYSGGRKNGIKTLSAQMPESEKAVVAPSDRKVPEKEKDELTFEEFNRLLDEVLEEREGESGEVEGSSSSAVGEAQVKDEDQEIVEEMGQDEEGSLPEEIRRQIVRLVSDIYGYAQQLKPVLDRARDMLLPNEEKARDMDELSSIGEKVLQSALELKRLYPDGVKIIKVRFFQEPFGIYMIAYEITVSSKLGEIVPEVSQYLPIETGHAGVEDENGENITFSDMLRRIREGVRSGRITRERVMDFAGRMTAGEVPIERTEIK